MKKILTVLFVSCVITMFCSCASKEAQAVDDLILSIGTVTHESKVQIDAARTAYDALDAKVKRDVKNLTILLDAENAFAKLPIELTSENFTDYLNIRITFAEGVHHTILSYSWKEATATLEIYPVAHGSFNNVNLKVDYWLDHGYMVSESEEMYEMSKEIEERQGLYHLVFDVDLPADGNYAETVNIETALGFGQFGLPVNKQVETLHDVSAVWESSFLPAGTPGITGNFTPN